MPVYEYCCEFCDNEQEEILSVKDYEDGVVVNCSECGKQTKRAYSKMTFQLKGMCWEKDGYCGKREAKGFD